MGVFLMFRYDVLKHQSYIGNCIQCLLYGKLEDMDNICNMQRNMTINRGLNL